MSIASGQLRDSIRDLTYDTRRLFERRRDDHHRHLTGSGFPKSKYPDPSIPVTRPWRFPTGDGVAVADAEYWLDHCARLSGRMDDFDHETRRGYTIASRLLGLSWDSAKRAIGAARTSGVEAAAAVWAPHMNAPDAKYVGHLYVAEHAQPKGIRKVGFTTNLDKRMKALSVMEGEKVRAVNSLPGTMLIEWALHMDLGPSVKSEWYPVEAIPSWLMPAEEAA